MASKDQSEKQGNVAERLIATDLKSVWPTGHEGSNPSVSAKGNKL